MKRYLVIGFTEDGEQHITDAPDKEMAEILKDAMSDAGYTNLQITIDPLYTVINQG